MKKKTYLCDNSHVDSLYMNSLNLKKNFSINSIDFYKYNFRNVRNQLTSQFFFHFTYIHHISHYIGMILNHFPFFYF